MNKKTQPYIPRLLLNFEEAAQLLNVTVRQLRRLIEQGMPTALSPSGKVCFDMDAMLDWRKKHTSVRTIRWMLRKRRRPRL